MKTAIVVFSALAVLGVVAAIWGHIGHLLFSVLPCSAVALAGYLDYRKEKKRNTIRSSNYTFNQPNNNALRRI